MQQLSREDTEQIKVFLAAVAMLLPIATYLWHRYAEPRANALSRWLRAGLDGVLALLVLGSFLNYSRLDFEYVWKERVDTYDLCHYYLNAKYYEELKYYGLYPAIVLADLEAGPHFARRTTFFQAQDEHDYYFVEYKDFDQDAAWHKRIHDSFGQLRWLEFQHDFTTLQRDMKGFTSRTWNEMLVDHGYNGSPAWTLLAAPIARLVPVESVKWLGYIDVLWLLGAVAATGWAFGRRSAAWMVVFLLTTYSTRWPTISWAFGRYDYVSLLVIAVALAAKGRNALAGAAVGISASFRIFPALWMWGPFAKGAVKLVQRRVLDRKLIALAAGFLVALLALEGAVLVRYGAWPIQKHFEKLSAHTTPENLSSMRQGFAIAVAYRGETDIQRMDPERRDRVKAEGPLRTAVAVGLVLLLGWGLRRARDHEALAMGFVPFFLLTTASYYYYVVRASLVAMHAGELQRARNAVGLSLLFAIEVVLNELQSHPRTAEFRVIHMGWMGWLCTLYALLMIGWFLWEAKNHPSEVT